MANFKHSKQKLFIQYKTVFNDLFCVFHDNRINTSHSAYVATETKLVGAKIDGLLPPIFLWIPKM